jgi:hypothetical protein
MDQTRKAITGVAADTFACVPILLIKLDAQGHMKRLEAKAREIISQPLHSGLVAHRRVRVWPAGRWFGGVHATLAMDVIEMLSLQVVRLKVLVRDWPRGRDPAMMTDLTKIFLTQPEKSRPIKLGISSYVVVCVGMEGLASDVLPDLLGVVLTLDIDETGIPIGFLARDIIASLEEQNSFSTRSQSVTQSPSARSRADDDDIEFILCAHNRYQ